MGETQADQVLDCRGVLCPMPVIRVSQAIKTIGVGRILELLTTDPGSRPDMEAWAKQTGHDLISSHEANGVFTFYVRRTK